MGLGIPAFITVHHCSSLVSIFSVLPGPRRAAPLRVRPQARLHHRLGTNIPPNPGISGLDKIPASRDAFWNVIEQFQATTFCGHEHMFNLMQPKGAAWQVLVGSGGSPWDAKQGEVTLA